LIMDDFGSRLCVTDGVERMRKECCRVFSAGAGPPSKGRFAR
jgi:hypothetical protein